MVEKSTDDDHTTTAQLTVNSIEPADLKDAMAEGLAGKDGPTMGALKRGLFADALAVLGSS